MFVLVAVMPGLSCRFYQHRFPEVEDVVMVNVRSIAEMGAYVSLLEYNNIEGMILLSELSRRRIRSINKLIRIGRNECVVVIRVDKEKGGLLNLMDMAPGKDFPMQSSISAVLQE